MALTEGQLRLGRLFESEFERQAHIRGYHVVRHCDQLGVTGTKAPVLTGPFAGYRLPDFTILANGQSYWLEVKYKSTATSYRNGGNDPQHGIDLPNWRDYLQICKLSGLPGFLILGEGHTGRIIAASFKSLERAARVYDLGRGRNVHFENGAVFWSASVFREWGEFDLRTGQMRFDFKSGFSLAGA
jgi:hypothetical protein